jgi:hypothetical protein
MKSLQIIIAFLISPVLLSSLPTHEYYVSVTTVEYVEEQQALQIISQIFIDDFEKLIRARYDKGITLNTENEAEAIETYMSRYLEDKLKVKVNDNFVNFKFIGKEYKDDIVYCYLEIENITDIKSITITNQILFDILQEQQNIVRLKMLNKNKSFLLLPDKDSCVLNFE